MTEIISECHQVNPFLAAIISTTERNVVIENDKIHRVKIKHPLPKELAIRRRLLALLAPQVKVFKFIPTHDSLITITASDKDTDAVFSEDSIKKLPEGGYQPLMPPESKSRRTVICFQLDELIHENSPEDIVEEVQKAQP